MPSSQDSENAQDLTRPHKVWLQLAEMFSKSFLRENGDEPPMLWKQAIWKLTDEQIITGLGNLGNDDLQFPPNLSQFIAACKRPKPANAPYWNKPKQIEDQRPSGRMSLAEWKKQNEAQDEA